MDTTLAEEPAAGAEVQAARPGKRGYHHGDLKEALKKAALTLVEQTGPRGFHLSQAAKQAGVSVAAPYRHFADKNALLAAIAEDGYRQLHGWLLSRALEEGPVLARLCEVGVAYVAFAQENPAAFQVMFESGLAKPDYPTLQEVADSVTAVVVGLIAEGQQEGVLPEGDPALIAAPAWALVHGIAALQVDGTLTHARWRRDPIELAREGMTQLLLGMGLRF